MSLFGGPHNEPPSLQSESDAEEFQEIPESPPQDEIFRQPEEQYDDFDDIYSDEESDDDGATRKKPLTQKELQKYRRWYRNEIHVYDAFETARAGDLGRNLLGAASERHVNLSKRPAKGVASWASRARWTDDRKARKALPAPHWTAWPLRPDEVPFPDERFNKMRDGGDDDYSRVKRRKLTRPSAQFEEALCDLAFRKARERVERESRLEHINDAEAEGESSSSEEEAYGTDSEQEQNKADTKYGTSQPDEDSTLAFAADQDRTRDILQPTIRSIMSKVDDLMTGLYHSRMNHRLHRSASHGENSQSSRPKSSSSSEGEKKEALGLRDWSEVLGMASLTGWDPKVVGRAAERCSKLFGEGMAFATLDAEDDSTKRFDYKPDMVPNFEEEEDEWTLDTLLCPHEDCARHTRRFDIRRRLRWHIKDVHDWDPEVEKRPREILGGVHSDGFLRQIPAQPGWRAKDKVKSGKRGGKRKKESSQEVDV